MSRAHLSAEELQQYILDKQECTPEDIAHVDSCPDCQAQVAAYTLLMKELGQQPAPVFGFDVSSMVLPQLVGTRAAERRGEQASERRVNRRTGWGMAALILVVAGVPAWLFRRSAYYVFTDISAIFLYLILAAAAVFMLLRVLHLVKRYQQIIHSINK
jgi:anti-sigma factor RsiW